MKKSIKKTTVALALLLSVCAFGQQAEVSNVVKKSNKGLKYMLEAEKVTSDVYQYFEYLWNVEVFDKVHKNDLKNMKMLQKALKKNNTEYTLSPKRGVFLNKKLQEKHDVLIAQGAESATKAIKTAKEIEEKKTVKLQAMLKTVSDDYLRIIYLNLLDSSEKNLKDFNKELSYLQVETTEEKGKVVTAKEEAKGAAKEATLVITDSELKDMNQILKQEEIVKNVYEYFDNQWGLSVFSKIQRNEKRQLTTVYKLFKHHNVTPTIGVKKGAFVNKETQKKYDDLVTRGSESPVEAIKVCKSLEENDIAMLKAAIKNSKSDYAKQVYSSLLKTSTKNLDAFNRQFSFNEEPVASNKKEVVEEKKKLVIKKEVLPVKKELPAVVKKEVATPKAPKKEATIKVTQKEIKEMKQMLEEERVAKEVYENLENQWGLVVFNDVQRCQKRQIKMIEKLLKKNNISFSAKGKKGVFADEKLQEKYENLITRGKDSPMEAMKVGAEIEGQEIGGLKETITTTKDADIKLVYSDLLKRSERNLKSFKSKMSK